MDLPYFRCDQPRESYYYTPVNVNTLGIVDCNNEKGHLHGYIYNEGEANKGGNVVALLLLKHLQERGLLVDGIKQNLVWISSSCIKLYLYCTVCVHVLYLYNILSHHISRKVRGSI